MKRVLAFAVCVAILAALAFLLRPRAPAATPAPPAPQAPPDPAPPAARPLPPPDPAPPSRTALVAYLERLGRAILVRDARTLAALELPRLSEADVPWLVEQIRSAELFVAVGAIDLLKRLRRTEALPALGDALLGRGSVLLKDVAADALGALGAAGPLLDALVADLDGSVRARVASALAGFDGPEVYVALARALKNDRDPVVRRAAAQALARLPSQDAVRIFLEQVARETDPVVAIEILAGTLDRGGEATVPALREAVRASAVLRSALEEEIKRRGPARYARAYAPEFFRPAAPIAWGGRRIGITVETGGIAVAEIAAALFSAAPLDRYREFFYLRRAEELAADLRDGVPAPRAYDGRGVPIMAGVPRNDLDGTVFVHFRDPRSFAEGVLGYTEGRESYVTSVSLLHEVGHALARLGDEYSSPAASRQEAANLDLAGRAPKWQPLVDQRHLPASAPRGDAFVAPGGACHMNNRATDDRFCPVCQLELIARICELCGAPVPW